MDDLRDSCVGCLLVAVIGILAVATFALGAYPLTAFFIACLAFVYWLVWGRHEEREQREARRRSQERARQEAVLRALRADGITIAPTMDGYIIRGTGTSRRLAGGLSAARIPVTRVPDGYIIGARRARGTRPPATTVPLTQQEFDEVVQRVYRAMNPPTPGHYFLWGVLALSGLGIVVALCLLAGLTRGQ